MSCAQSFYKKVLVTSKVRTRSASFQSTVFKSQSNGMQWINCSKLHFGPYALGFHGLPVLTQSIQVTCRPASPPLHDSSPLISLHCEMAPNVGQRFLCHYQADCKTHVELLGKHILVRAQNCVQFGGPKPLNLSMNPDRKTIKKEWRENGITGVRSEYQDYGV